LNDTRAEREAAMSHSQQATKEDLEEWLDSLKHRKRDDGRLFLNTKQIEAVEKVAKKVQESCPIDRSVRQQLLSHYDESCDYLVADPSCADQISESVLWYHNDVTSNRCLAFSCTLVLIQTF